MKVLVTGAKGFIGKNLCYQLENEKHEVFRYDLGNTIEELSSLIDEVEFIFHLAGINRPLNVEEFYLGNSDLTKTIIELIEKKERKIPILLSSSIQAALENDYGKSKFQAEEHVHEYGIRNGTSVFIYRLANVFGKWSKPNYNTVVATFCYKIARGETIEISDPSKEVSFVYIDDVVKAFVSCLKLPEYKDKYLEAEPIYTKTLQELADLLYSYKKSRDNFKVVHVDDEFSKKLYSTYLSFLAEDDFAYSSVNHIDDRGSFSELFKGNSFGQVSVNISKPGITKGNHWHHTKTEKFVVVKGSGLIRFRKIDDEKIIEYPVSGDIIQIIDIPPGYTHSIVNTGKEDLVTIIWANELFDEENPDTYYLEVQ